MVSPFHKLKVVPKNGLHLFGSQAKLHPDQKKPDTGPGQADGQLRTLRGGSVQCTMNQPAVPAAVAEFLPEKCSVLIMPGDRRRSSSRDPKSLLFRNDLQRLDEHWRQSGWFCTSPFHRGPHR
jgi:hypothetical protein